VLQYNPKRDEIFCGRGWPQSEEVEVVNCATNRIVDTLPCANSWIVHHSAVGKFYMGDFDPPAAVVDAASDSVVTTIPEVRGLRGFANETDCKVYAVLGAFGSLVTVIDARTDSVTTRITSIPAPKSVAHDVLNDKVYIPSGTEPGRVFVLDGGTDAILDSIPVLGIRPFDAIWNPRDGRVYVCNPYSGSISVLRDSLVPGVQEVVAAPRSSGSATVMRRLSLSAGLREADIYDISGRRVAQLSKNRGSAGLLAPGVYFVREEPQAAGSKPQAVRKVVLTE
jgi:DNA-binding beta-propeller fold protein YncE